MQKGVLFTEQNKKPSASDNLNQTRMFNIPQSNPDTASGNSAAGRPSADALRSRMNAADKQNPQRPANAQRPVSNPQIREQHPTRPVQQPQNIRQTQTADSARADQVPNRAVNRQNMVNPAPAKTDKPAVQPRRTPEEIQRAREEQRVREEQRIREEQRAREMQAKTTEVKRSGFTDSGLTVKKKKEKVRFTDGEGGNTVVSVIKAIVYIIFVVIISVFASIFIILVGNDVFAFVKNDEVRDVVIPEYATLDEVATILYENEIIAYPKIFKLYAVAEKDDGEYVAGTYSISPMYNYEELLDAFKEKPVTGWQEIMIPEGYTTDDIINLFISRGIGTKEGFVDVINNYEFDYWFIDELGEDWSADGRIYRLDGYLFPDTYQFYNNSSEVTVIKKLLKRFNQIFTQEYRNQCAEMGYTVDEMITLASMIEKEAGSSAEFFYVSSVFHNRLNNPYVFPKLESDATIVYAIQHDTGTRPALTGSDLTYDTPYNTYTHNGLPPGPIANPSASAMLAALSPTKTNYYFFVSDAGVTYFSETKDEHEAYIAKIASRQSSAAQQTTGDMSAEEAAASGQTEGQTTGEAVPAA